MIKKLSLIVLLLSVLVPGLCFSHSPEDCPIAAPISSNDYFSIALLPDIQYYTCQENPSDITNACARNRGILEAQMNWIIGKQTDEKIAYVVGVGDNVEHVEYNDEWTVVQNAFGQLEDELIPYGIAVGNHDQLPSGQPYYDCNDPVYPNTTANYNVMFNAEHFLVTYPENHGGNFNENLNCIDYDNNNDNHYDYFSAGGTNFLVLFIEYYRENPYSGGNYPYLSDYSDPNPNAFTVRFKTFLNEMKAVVDQHPDKKIIIVSHSLLLPTIESGTGKYNFSRQGKYIYEYFKNYSNLVLMLGGHYDYDPVSPKELKRIDGHINTVVSCFHSPRIQTTPPIPANSGDSKMRLLRFYPIENQIQVVTFNFHVDESTTTPPQPAIACIAPTSYTMSNCPLPNAVITNPTDGQTLGAGTLTNITWTYSDITANIKLQLYQNGSLLGTIVSSCSVGSNGNGSYQWEAGKYTDSAGVVHYASGGGYSIQLNTVDNSYYVQSAGTFSIGGSVTTISVTSPTTGDNWIVNSQHNITWDYYGAITYVKIEYSIDGGNNYLLIASPVAVSTKTYPWTIPNNPSNTCKIKISDLNGPTYGENGLFTISTIPSTCGTDWDVVYDAGPEFFNAITYSNNLYIAVGKDGLIWKSSNGQDWTLVNHGLTTNTLYEVNYYDSKFMAMGSCSTMMTSTDGANWTKTSVAGTQNHVFDFTYSGSRYVAVCNGGTILTSTDRINWTSYASGNEPYNLNSVAYGASKFVVVGKSGKIFYSSNGTQWTQVPGTPTPYVLYGITYGNGQFVAVGEQGTIITSTDGITWSAPKNVGGITDTLNDVTYAANIYVVVGSGGKILTSTNGTNWTSRTSYTPMALYGVGYGVPGFVAGGNYTLDFSDCQ